MAASMGPAQMAEAQVGLVCVPVIVGLPSLQGTCIHTAEDRLVSLAGMKEVGCFCSA